MSENVEKTIETLKELAEKIGFESMGDVEAAKLEIKPEVREMCAADRCHNYGRNWACPPDCGDISEYQKEFEKHKVAVLFQTVAQMEDSFDFETMMETAENHDKRTCKLQDEILNDGELSVFQPALYILGAGACKICPTCAHPEPCRFPDKRIISMEAAGLVVNEVCTHAGIPYNHGKDTICYTSCVLI